MVWHYTEHGSYSVKSGYYVALQCKKNRLNVGESSNYANNNGIWKVIWNLKIPPKVKNFLWRACKEILPVRERLRRRGVDCSKTCPVCNEDDETVLHTLAVCPAARVVWFASSLGLRSELIMASSFLDWFIALVKTLNEQQVALVAMIAWRIWYVRNGHAHGDYQIEPIGGLHRSLALLKEYDTAREGLRGHSISALHPTCNQWAKPPAGTLKLNVDASVKRNGFVGVGFVVRDHTGVVIAAGVDRFMGNLGVLCAEALAVRCGLAFMVTGHHQSILVESDCSRVVDLLNEEALEELSYLTSIICDCKKLARQLRNVSFVFSSRSCNRVAHELAGLVQSWDFIVPKIWIGCIHPSVYNLVVSDNSVLI